MTGKFREQVIKILCSKDKIDFLKKIAKRVKDKLKD